MRRFVRSKPSPAMVVAMVALFVALGGSAVAVSLPGKNSVNGGDVRNNSIGAADVRNGSLKAADVDADITVRSVEIPPFVTATLDCRDQAAISGGGTAGDPHQVYLATSRPIPGDPSAWVVEFGQISGGSSPPSTAYVVCADL